MASAYHLNQYGTYEQFRVEYEKLMLRPGPTSDLNDLLGGAMTNADPIARVEIGNRLLDDGADPSEVTADYDRINVLHALWGRKLDRDPVGESALVGRLLDGGADINLRSPRFGLPLGLFISAAITNDDYLRATFRTVAEHSRPDLTAPLDSRRKFNVGYYLAESRFGLLRDEVHAYAAASGQDLSIIS